MSPQTGFGLGGVISSAGICFPSHRSLFIVVYFIASFEYQLSFWAVVLSKFSDKSSLYTYQYKCGGVKASKKGKGLASGCCKSLKNAAELCMWQRKRHEETFVALATCYPCN